MPSSNKILHVQLSTEGPVSLSVEISSMVFKDRKTLELYSPILAQWLMDSLLPLLLQSFGTDQLTRPSFTFKVTSELIAQDK